VLFQGFPYRPPGLRGRFHHDFFDLALSEPVGEPAEVGRRRADLLALEVEVAVDLDVGHYHRQHLLVDVDSCDPVRHRSLLGERRACLVASVRVASCRRFSLGPNGAQLFGQSRTLRIKQLLGLTVSTGWLRSRRSREAIVASRQFSSPFGSRRPRVTVAEIVQCGEHLIHFALLSNCSFRTIARVSWIFRSTLGLLVLTMP
jgi:hypothetical protein